MAKNKENKDLERKKRVRGHKSYTAWHVFLAEVMDYVFEPKYLLVHPFQKLGTLPLESDFIIIRQNGSIPELIHLYPDFRFLISYLGEITVIEYKSPLDTLSCSDFDILRIYMLMTKRKYEATEDHQVVGISLTSRFETGYAQYVQRNGYKFEEVEEGIYAHRDGHRNYYWIDLVVIGKKDPGNFINLFSSNYKKYYQSNKLNIRGGDIIAYIWQAIFRRKLGMMNNIEIRQLPEFTSSVEEMLKRFLESLPLEERLAGLKPEERLAGLNPEERLAGLKPEEIAARLKPEERLAGLKPEEIVAGFDQKKIKKLKELLEQRKI